MFVHVRSNANNCRISSTGNGQQKLKKLNMAAEEGAKQGSLLFYQNSKEENHEK